MGDTLESLWTTGAEQRPNAIRLFHMLVHRERRQRPDDPHVRAEL
jgi:hypothetical protein